MLQRLRSTKLFNRKIKFSGIRLALSTLVFVLGFIGVGLLLNKTIAYDANPNATTTRITDCNYYVLIHDTEGNPVEGAIAEAIGKYYSYYSSSNEYGEPGTYNTHNTVGFTSPSDENGWAHLTTCDLLIDDKADTHELKEISFSLSEESARQKKISELDYEYSNDRFDTHRVGDQNGYLSNMVDASLFPDTSSYDPAVIGPSNYIEVSSERGFLRATINGSEVFPGTNLDPNGIIGYNYGVYSTTLVSRFLYVSSIMVAPSINTTVTKVWNNADGSHTWPEGKTIQVNVQYGDNEPEILTLDADHPTMATSEYAQLSGRSFTVSEVSIDGYTSNITGNDEEGYTITNTEDIPKGNLNIRKTTSDNNTTDSFNVTVTLSGTSIDGQHASTVSGQYGDVIFDDGIATFDIKHNQTINIASLPVGLNYIVEEQESEEYAPLYSNKVGTIAKNATITATITNKPLRKFTMWLKKVDGDTGEELHDWEFSVGDSNPITEENNKLWEYIGSDTQSAKLILNNGTTYTACNPYSAPYCDSTYHSTGWLDTSGSIWSINIKESKTPPGYREVYGFTGSGRYGSYEIQGDDHFEFTPDSRLTMEYHKIDDYNGELIAKNYKASFFVNKLDNDGNPLNGATIEMTGINVDSAEVETLTWISDGSTKELFFKESGMYSVREVASPKGYKKTDTIYNLCLTTKGELYMGSPTEDYVQPCKIENGKIVRNEGKGTQGYYWQDWETSRTISITNQKVPWIGTLATDNADGDKIIKLETNAKVKDNVEYIHLEPNKEYIMSGELVKKSTGEVIATAQIPFIPEETGDGSGTVELTFEFDATKVAGEELVVYETVLDNDGIVVEHKNLNDPDQTVTVEPLPEEPKEESKEPPVTIINPKTEDKKMSTLIIMMGSAVLLFGTIVVKRHRCS